MIDADLAKSIKYVGFDVDGVLTDGGIYLGDVDGKRLEFKRYDIQDGLGMTMLRRAGIQVGIFTGRVSESVTLRADELRVNNLAQDPDGYKLAAFREVIAGHSIEPSECAFVGDDFPDLPILRIVGLPVAVGNAAKEIVRECRVHLDAAGGRGAVRQFCELLLKARGQWEYAWQGYVAERTPSEEMSKP